MQKEFETKVALEKMAIFHFIDRKKNADFQQIKSSRQ